MKYGPLGNGVSYAPPRSQSYRKRVCETQRRAALQSDVATKTRIYRKRLEPRNQPRPDDGIANRSVGRGASLSDHLEPFA